MRPDIWRVHIARHGKRQAAGPFQKPVCAYHSHSAVIGRAAAEPDEEAPAAFVDGGQYQLAKSFGSGNQWIALFFGQKCQSACRCGFDYGEVPGNSISGFHRSAQRVGDFCTFQMSSQCFHECIHGAFSTVSDGQPDNFAVGIYLGHALGSCPGYLRR